VDLCTWSYDELPQQRLTELQAKETGISFLRAKCPFYREEVPVTLRTQGEPDNPVYVVRQNVRGEGATYLVRLKMDAGGRPLVYGVTEWSQEHAALSPTRITQEQALSIAHRAIARDPSVTLQTISLVLLGTRTPKTHAARARRTILAGDLRLGCTCHHG